MTRNRFTLYIVAILFAVLVVYLMFLDTLAKPVFEDLAMFLLGLKAPALVLTEAEAPHVQVVKRQPTVKVEDLVLALADVFQRARLYSHHHIQGEPLSVRERMSSILDSLQQDRYTDFTALFTVEEGRRGVIVTLLAVLELVREMLIELVQAKPLGPIHVRAQTS